MLQERDTSLWEAVKNRAKEVAGKIRAIVDAYKGERMDSTEGKIVANMKEILPQLEELYAEGLADTRGEAATDSDAGTKKAAQDGGVKYYIRESFYKEYDEWDKKDTNKRFVVGMTSDVLKPIDMKDQEIILKSGTVLQKISKHKEIEFGTFKEIPELLEHPIIVQFSDAINPETNKPKYDSRISVLG